MAELINAAVGERVFFFYLSGVFTSMNIKILCVILCLRFLVTKHGL